MPTDWQPVETAPVGVVVNCKREGEWSDAPGLWTGKQWEGRGKPAWYRDTLVLMPMKGPTHWMSIGETKCEL